MQISNKNKTTFETEMLNSSSSNSARRQGSSSEEPNISSKPSSTNLSTSLSSENNFSHQPHHHHNQNKNSITSNSSETSFSNPSSNLNRNSDPNYQDQDQQSQPASFDLTTFQESGTGYPFLRALHSFDASTLFTNSPDEDPSSICLSFQESEIVLLHSIHPSGWGDATILSNASRGWIPTNYFTPYSDPKIVPVLSAVLNFVLAPKSHPLPKPYYNNDSSNGRNFKNGVTSSTSDPADNASDSNSTTGGSDEEVKYTFSPPAISAIVAGVRSLLEACGTLTRDTPIVRRSQSIRKFRKILLAELAILVSLAKQYKYTTDDANIERLVTGSYKIIFRAVIFLDIWTIDMSNTESNSTIPDLNTSISSQQLSPTSPTSGIPLIENQTENSQNEKEPNEHKDDLDQNQQEKRPQHTQPSTQQSQKPQQSLRHGTPSIDNLRNSLGNDEFSPQRGQFVRNIDTIPEGQSDDNPLGPESLGRLSTPNTAVPAAPRNNRNANRESVVFHLSPPYALHRLDEVNDALTSYLGNFLHRTNLLDSDPSACTQLLLNTRKSMLACRELLATVESISSRYLPRNRELEECKDKLFNQIKELVTAARDVVASTPASDLLIPQPGSDDEVESYNTKNKPENDTSNTKDKIETSSNYKGSQHATTHLITIARECAKTSGECVVRCRYILERVGDFQLSPTRDYPDFSDGIIAVYNNDQNEDASNDTNNMINAYSSLSISEETQSPTSDTNSNTETLEKSKYNMDLHSKHASLLPKIPAISPLIPLGDDSSPAGNTVRTELSVSTNTSLIDNNPFSATTPTTATLLSPVPRNSSHVTQGNNSRPNSYFSSPLNTSAPTTPLSANTTPPAPIDDIPRRGRSFTTNGIDTFHGSLNGGTSISVVPEEDTLEFDGAVDEAVAARNAAILKAIEEIPLDERILKDAATGRVRAGTLEALVKTLTDENCDQDPCFISAFFLNFRQFTNPYDLAEALIKRYNQTEGEVVDDDMSESNFESIMTRRSKIYSTIKRWMESHWYQSTDAPALPLIMEFAKTNSMIPANAKATLTELCAKVTQLPDNVVMIPRLIMVPGGNVVRTAALSYSHTPVVLHTVSKHQAALLLKNAEATEQEIASSEDDDKSNSNGQSSETRSRNNSLNKDPNSSDADEGKSTVSSSSWSNSLRMVKMSPHQVISILDIDALDIAKQLAVLDNRLFCKIKPSEFLDQNFSLKRRHLGLALNINAMTMFTNQLSSFVGDSILNADVPIKTRQKLLKHWIKVAERSFELHNFNSLMTIISALQSVNIMRLRKTWEGLSARHITSFTRLKTLLSMEKNYSNYRTELRNISLPCVPFLGLYLTDLTFVGEGNPTMRALTVDIEHNNEIILVSGHKYPLPTKQINNHHQQQLHKSSKSEDTTSSTASTLTSNNNHNNNNNSSMFGSNKNNGPTPPSFLAINFDRFDRITRIIGEVQNFQIPYRVASSTELQSWLKAEMAKSYMIVTKDHNGLWRRSCIVEPKQ